VDGIATVDGQDVFVLKMIQGRDSDWANRVFLARFDAQATWLDQLKPAFDERKFFFEQTLWQLAGETGIQTGAQVAISPGNVRF